MIAFHCINPDIPDATMRLFGLTPLSMGIGFQRLKVSLQPISNGRVMAEYPIWSEWMTIEELNQWIAERRGEGWSIEPDEKALELQTRIDAAAKRDRNTLTKRRWSGTAADTHYNKKGTK